MLNKISYIVKAFPHTIAYKVHNEYITYYELWYKSEYYANYLKRQGTSPVIIYGHKEIEVVISILACLMANRTYVPVDTSTPLNRLKDIIKITKSTLVLTNEKIDLDITLKLDELKQFERNDIQNQDNDIVYMIFTSGSTGIPKCVPISNDNLMNFSKWFNSLNPLGNYKNIRVLNQANFSFDLSVADFYYALTNGHTLVALDNYEDVYEVMKDVEVAVMTPTLMKYCLLNEDFNGNIYSSLRCVYFCGEALDVKTVKKLYERFSHLIVINAYGPTEATSAVSAVIITRDMCDMNILPIGETSNFATDIDIIDGEIVLKGKSVFGGYLGYDGGYTQENGINCYRTGDIGYIENGLLFTKGRKDRQIKYKGYRIELDEIENNINKIPGVKDCAVVAKYQDLVVKTIKAYVVGNIDSDYIRSELMKYLPSYMIPKSIQIIDKLPINQNGKIDRKALNEL